MKKILINILTIAILTVASYEVSFAQISNTVYASSAKNIIREKKSNTDDVVGSPYLVDGWVKGNVKFKDNSFARNGDLKYDVQDDVLVVKGEDGVENVFAAPVDEFTLNVGGKERLFKTGANKYVKENKLNLKEDNDIIKLFNYYNTL
jgi:hypothetical protein